VKSRNQTPVLDARRSSSFPTVVSLQHMIAILVLLFINHKARNVPILPCKCISSGYHSDTKYFQEIGKNFHGENTAKKYPLVRSAYEQSIQLAVLPYFLLWFQADDNIPGSGCQSRIIENIRMCRHREAAVKFFLLHIIVSEAKMQRSVRRGGGCPRQQEESP